MGEMAVPAVSGQGSGITRRPKAARSALLLFSIIAAVCQCASDADRRQLESLTSRLFSALNSPDSVAWDAFFYNLDGSEIPGSPVGESRINQGVQTGRIEKINFLPMGDARITVSIQGERATSHIALRAKKIGVTWKFDKEFQATMRIDGPIRSVP
jgi:hypothetical protein